MENFLPKGYEVPASPSNYMKLQDGENTFRVLSSAVVGFEYWNVEGKPVRLKEHPQAFPVDIRVEKDGSKKIKPFWAFVVWNYQTKQIQILELTQKSIMNAVKAVVDNAKWGNPQGYDITITKTGEGLDTEYSTIPSPHSPIDTEIENARKEKSIDLTALFEGLDPFAVNA